MQARRKAKLGVETSHKRRATAIPSKQVEIKTDQAHEIKISFSHACTALHDLLKPDLAEAVYDGFQRWFKETLSPLLPFFRDSEDAVDFWEEEKEILEMLQLWTKPKSEGKDGKKYCGFFADGSPEFKAVKEKWMTLQLHLEQKRDVLRQALLTYFKVKIEGLNLETEEEQEVWMEWARFATEICVMVPEKPFWKFGGGNWKYLHCSEKKCEVMTHGKGERAKLCEFHSLPVWVQVGLAKQSLGERAWKRCGQGK